MEPKKVLYNDNERQEKNKTSAIKHNQIMVSKNKVKISEKDLMTLKGDIVIDDDELAYVAFKENKGEDIPDEQIMGNLIGKIEFAYKY